MKTLLVIAHPGHEVAAHHAMMLFEPHIYCLTDGSSSTGQARHWDCHNILQKQNLNGYANIQTILKEEIVYQAIIEQDFDFFKINVVNSLQELIANQSPEKIIFDAYEGYNPIHDLLNFFINYICCELSERKQICLMELKLTEDKYLNHRELSHVSQSELSVIPAFNVSKYNHARFLSEYIQEIPQDLNLLRWMSNKKEVYLQLDPCDSIKTVFFEEIPFYEHHGRMRVSEGKFSQAIEFEKHIFPLLCYFLRAEK